MEKITDYPATRDTVSPWLNQGMAGFYVGAGVAARYGLGSFDRVELRYGRGHVLVLAPDDRTSSADLFTVHHRGGAKIYCRRWLARKRIARARGGFPVVPGEQPSVNGDRGIPRQALLAFAVPQEAFAELQQEMRP